MSDRKLATMMLNAVWNEDVRGLRRVLRMGADPNWIFNGYPILIHAVFTRNEKIMMLLPYSADSNNYATSLITRPIDTSAAVKEPLLTKSVRMEVTCEHKNKEKVIQYMISCGGYEIHS